MKYSIRKYCELKQSKPESNQYRVFSKGLEFLTRQGHCNAKFNITNGIVFNVLKSYLDTVNDVIFAPRL